jgi:hypothetical protein
MVRSLQALKQSVPDGYTIEVTSDTPMTVNPWIYKNIPYDPLRDFIPVVPHGFHHVLAAAPVRTSALPNLLRCKVEGGRTHLCFRRRW